MVALHGRHLLAGIGSALTVGLAGCGSDSGDEGTDTEPETGRDTEPTTETRTGTARLRVAHMSPDAPDVVASVDGDVVPADLGIPFSRVGDYAEVPAGTRQFTVTELNGDDVFFDQEVTLDAADYTFVAAGEVIDDRELSLNGGTVYTAFASGYLDVEFASDASFELTVVQDAGP
jgi:hypothetical protein